MRGKANQVEWLLVVLFITLPVRAQYGGGTGEPNDPYLIYTAEQMNAVAEYLELPTIQVYEVATFYSMFQTREVGRNEVAICTNVSCMLRGAEDIVAHVENKLGVKLGESTGDGYTPPQGVVNVSDTQAYILAVQHKYGAPHTTWIDLHGLGPGSPPNFIANVADLQLILFGFEGQKYVDSPAHLDPSECP